MPLPDFDHHQRFQRGGGGPGGMMRWVQIQHYGHRYFFAAPASADCKTSATTSPATAAAENSQT